MANMAPNTAQAAPPQAGEGAQNGTHTNALVIVTLLFFMWGLITSLNDVLIPHLKAIYTLSYVQAMLVQLCFFGAYFIVSLPAGALVKRISYKWGIVLGLVIAAVGCALFVPAASYRIYVLFLGALFVLASGITLLQVSANPYVTVLGPPDTAASRLTLTHAFNSLGTTLAPMFGAKFGSAFGDVPALYLWERLGRESNKSVRGYPSGGYRSVIDALRASIEAGGGEVRTNAPVRLLEAGPDRALVTLSDGETIEADHVVSTVPLPALRASPTGSSRAKSTTGWDSGSPCSPGWWSAGSWARSRSGSPPTITRP